jgi:hypothetical protein
MIPLRSAFAATMRMIDWIFRDPACHGSTAEPAHSTRFPPRQILLVSIADLANGRAALGQNSPQFAGWQF